MASIAIFRINYKSDFVLTLHSDAGWLTPFCIKFWTGAPSQAYFAGYDGTTYTHCAPVDGEPTKLKVQFDDHHLPIGELKFQIAYHFTVADFPNDTEDEVLNQASVIIEKDDNPMQVMLDFNGETAPEIEFSLPAYANEAQRIANEEQRIANEQQRIANEEARIAAETIRQQNEAQRISNEESRVAEFAQLKQESKTATADANSAAALANEKAALAADKAALADAAATLANAKAQLAADKAALADAAATLANDKAALAQQKAEYAQTQGNYAKSQGDYAKKQGEIAEEDHERAEADHTTAADDHQTAASDHTRAEQDHATAASDHTRAEEDHSTASADHTTAANDHTQAVNDHATATSDHTQAGNDHDRAESDHSQAAQDHERAESDHAAVEVYVDSLGAFDISAYHATGDVLAKYADLTAALDPNNGGGVPQSLQKGGMSVKFVQSSDNKYMQYRLMSDTFNTTEANWQGVDDEPTAGSDDLVKSGGVNKAIFGEDVAKNTQSNITYGKLKSNSDKTIKIEQTPNGNYRLAFFGVTGGKTYKLHVEETTTWAYVYGFTNTLLSSDVTQDEELGGIIGSDSHISGTSIEYNKLVTAPSGLSYMVVAYMLDGGTPTLKEVSDSDVVLYKEQFLSEEKKQIARNNIGAYPQSNGDLLEEKVEDIKTTLDYNLSSDNITPDVYQSENILPYGVVFSGNSNFVTDYIKVKKDDIIKVTSFSERYTGFCQTVPVLNATCIDYKHYVNNAELLNAEIVSPIDGYFTLGRPKTGSETVFVIINKGLQVQINEITNNTDYNTFFPKYLYDVDNAERQTLQRIRIESLIDERLRLDINKGNGFLVHKLGSNTSTVETQTRDISVGLGNVEHKKGSINVVTTKASAITGKLVKYLAIGDSWCATNAEKDLHGNTATPWNYECAALNDFIKTQIDLDEETSKMISIGFASGSNIPDRTLTYKGQSYTLRSRNEGRGGWNAQTYLRHPVNVRHPGAGDMNGKVAWDAIGLGRKQPYGGTYDESATYTDYTGSTAQITEYLTTAMGYYHWDYSTELMNWLGITGTYSGTAEQKTAIDEAMVKMLDYRWQGNPFYDWNTAISSHGAYAFSLAKYLERFKTREEDGVTPLVKGETAGTRVGYQSQINDYAVCTPTHVTIELGINDWGGLSINQRASDIEMIAQLIHNYNSNINVGIVQVHIPGSFYPSAYSNEGMLRSISDWHIENYTKPLFDLNKKLSDDINNYQGVSGVYYVPTYFVEGNLSSGASYQENAVGNELLLDGTDELHASLNEHLEIGSQIFSWLVYTLSQS